MTQATAFLFWILVMFLVSEFIHGSEKWLKGKD